MLEALGFDFLLFGNLCLHARRSRLAWWLAWTVPFRSDRWVCFRK
jgi:hypothetical protein